MAKTDYHNMEKIQYAGNITAWEEHGHINGDDTQPAYKRMLITEPNGSPAGALATKIQTSGTTNYIGYAAPGTVSGVSLWQAMKVDSSGNVTYADGDANFDNIATDLTTLSYS